MLVIKHIDTGIEIDNLLEQVGIDDQNSLLAYAANTAYRYMDKYVPKSNGQMVKTGTGEMFIPGGRLRADHEIYPEGNSYVIEYKQPYARYQYYGERIDGSHKVQNYTTPGTGPYWDLAMLTAEGERYFDELNDFVEKRLR